MLFLVLSATAFPARSQAGVIAGIGGLSLLIGGGGNHPGEMGRLEGLAFLVFGAAAVYASVNWVNSAYLFLLDEKAGPASPQIQSALAARYPELEGNMPVLEKLASEIILGAPTARKLDDGTFYYTFPADKVRSILAPTGLLEADPAAVERIVRDLG